MPNVDKYFKYSIGDLVTTKAQRFLIDRRAGTNRPDEPQVLHIMERLLQQCHGGVQIFYRVRVTLVNAAFENPAFAREVFELTEPELAPYPPKPKVAPKPKGYVNKAALMRGVAMVARAPKKG